MAGLAWLTFVVSLRGLVFLCSHSLPCHRPSASSVFLICNIKNFYRLGIDLAMVDLYSIGVVRDSSPTMRKIERLMNDAIKASKDWKLDNTAVVALDNHSEVYLYDNLIARIGETWIQLFDGGWRTHTTKSRLNAILEGNGLPEEGVFQKKGVWYVLYNGSPIPFFSGMRLN